MKTVSEALGIHIRGSVTTLATCWLLTLKNGTVFSMTDHDQDIEVDGVIYSADSAYTRTAVETSQGMAVDNLNVVGILDDENISAADLRNRLFDFARLRIFTVNWADPSQGILKLRSGWLGEVKLNEYNYEVEVRGLMQALTRRIVELYQPDCRADLGDTRCKIDLVAITQVATVTTVVDHRTIIVSGLSILDPATFVGGLGNFLTGDATGWSMEVKEWDSATSQITFFLPCQFPIQVGDTLNVYPGCDKSISVCCEVFANVINFRGEMYCPGLDRLLFYPNAQG